MRLILALALVLTLALGALTASAAEPEYTVYGPFAGSSTNADAQAFCVAAGHDSGFVRNYRNERAQRQHLYYCADAASTN